MHDLIEGCRWAFMVLAFRIRDTLRPRRRILEEVGLRPGFRVLDFGCGTGSYLRETVRRVGERGEVWAMDENPRAVHRVRRLAAAWGLRNVYPIHSDGATGLPDESMDAVLLYDTLHLLKRREEALEEIRRVLKPDGLLSVSDHHLRPEEIVRQVTARGRFALGAAGRFTHSFGRVARIRTACK